MAGLDLRAPRRRLAVWVLTLPLAAACAHGPAASEETPSEADPATAPAAAPIATPPVPRPKRTPPPPPDRPAILVEIDPAEETEEDSRRSLVEASRAARARRDAQEGTGEKSRPLAVINNDNLDEYAEAGELTFAEGEEIPAEAAAPDPETPGVEDYWRDRSAELRDQWRRAVEERQETEDRAALLRRRFYAEDDPFVRDGQIKPQWDQSLERVIELRREEEALRRQLDDLYAEGTLAGADPEWLGQDEEALDPEEEPLETGTELESHEVQNPPY